MYNLETKIAMALKQAIHLQATGCYAGAIEAERQYNMLSARYKRIGEYIFKRDQRYGRPWIGAD